MVRSRPVWKRAERQNAPFASSRSLVALNERLRKRFSVVSLRAQNAWLARGLLLTRSRHVLFEAPIASSQRVVREPVAQNTGVWLAICGK